MNQPMTKALFWGWIALAALLSACATPMAPPTGKVVIHTPYGAHARASLSPSSYFQSTVVPQNLESVVDHFRVYLRGTNGALDRPSFTVPFGEAAEFVFDGVPPGTYNLDVLAFQYADETSFDIDNPGSYNNVSIVARGRLNGIVVDSGGVTVTDLVTVSPIDKDHGTFELRLRGIPSDVTGFSLDYNVVFVNGDGSFYILPFGGPDTNANGTLDYIETSSLPDYLETTGLTTDGPGKQLVLKSNHNFALQTGTFFLQVKFKGIDGYFHSFQPLFTIQVFKNLNSTLEVNLGSTLLGQPLGGSDAAPLVNLTTSTDPSLAVTVGWSRTSTPNYVSHYQIARTLDPDSAGPPTTPEILATLPNINGIDSWATGVQLQPTTLPKAKFWVRKIYSGMRPSNWAAVTAGLADQGSFSTTLPQVTITGPVATTAALPVANFNGGSSFAPASSVWLLDGRTLQTNPSASIDTLILDTSNLTAGVHRLVLKATDGLGVTYSSPPYTLKVREAPTGKVVFSRYGNSTYWLRPDGTLWAWGLNGSGQLGDGSAVTQYSPVFVANNVADVSAGGAHVLVAKTDGTLWASGDNGYGQWGIGSNASSVSLTQVSILGIPVTGVVKVAAQQSGSFILKADGTLWSAGYNGSPNTLGRLNGSSDSTFTMLSSPLGFTDIQTGDYTAFALRSDGTLWATGWDVSGANQLGTGGSAATLTQVALPGTIAGFSAGRFDTFVVMSDGKLLASGSNTNGNQGNGGSIPGSFQQVTGLAPVKSVSTGGYHTVLVMQDGTVKTAGANDKGQLGLGFTSNTNEFLFQTVPGLTGVQSATAGLQDTAFLTDQGLFVAGVNAFGEVGNGTTITQSSPVRIDVLPQTVKVISGTNRNFVIKQNGTIWGAGINTNGELGNGTTANLGVFTQVLGASTVASVATGTNHTLFLKTDGSVWGAGASDVGQLGLGATVAAPTPVQILSPGAAKAVAAGDQYSLVLLVDGTVVATGLNQGGVLGQGNTTSLNTFTAVTGVDRIVTMAAGVDHAFLLRSDGTLFGAGVASPNINNPLGFPGQTAWAAHTVYSAVSIPGLAKVSKIVAGNSFSALIGSDGSLWVAGTNSQGQLGLGDTTRRNSGFVKVIDDGVEDVVAATNHTLVLRKNKTLWGMGSSAAVGSASDQYSPTLIASDVLSLGAGGKYSYFTRNDGTLWWMGFDIWNANGISGVQGDVTFFAEPTPQRVF